MIVAIGAEHGAPVSKSAAAELILPFSAAVFGRGASQLLLGWLPGLGNVLNAATAAALTEAIGWAADGYFGAARSIQKIPFAGRGHCGLGWKRGQR